MTDGRGQYGGHASGDPTREGRAADGPDCVGLRLIVSDCLPHQVIPHEKDALPTDLIQLLMLQLHPPGREPIWETLELALHSLQVR